MNNYDVIVVGAGPAGLLAAGRAAELGAKVLVLEKMKTTGRKLLITGKGRCNITNSAPISLFIKHVFPKGRFLKSAFSKYYSKDILNLLEKYGVKTILERGGRYFPQSNKSADVLNALLNWLHDLNVEIRCGNRVEELLCTDNVIKGIRVNGATIKTKRVILSTGGKSYPATGSTGDGYELAKKVGHSVEKPLPALVPLITEENIAKSLQGLTLKNVNASIWINNKKVGDNFGEMTFTDFGLSGPITLSLSRIAVKELHKESKVGIIIDLKPALDEQKLDARLIRDLNEHGKKKISNVFRLWLPSAMIPVFMELLNIDRNKVCHQITSKERKRIKHTLKNFPFTVINHRPFKEAIITAGGIPTTEISQKTMESKHVKGLYFAGELIDLDAETGGYNLQIAYSTGWLAGHSCMQS